MTSSIEPGTTIELAGALADLPARVRVHELARRAGLNSKQVIAALSGAGVDVGSASSSVDREVAEAVLTSLLGGGDGPAAAAAAGRPTAGLEAATAAVPDTEPPAGDRSAPSAAQQSAGGGRRSRGSEARGSEGRSGDGRGQGRGRGKAGSGRDAGAAAAVAAVLAAGSTAQDRTSEAAAAAAPAQDGAATARAERAGDAPPADTQPPHAAGDGDDTPGGDGEDGRRRRRRGRRGRGRAADGEATESDTTGHLGTESPGATAQAGEPVTAEGAVEADGAAGSAADDASAEPGGEKAEAGRRGGRRRGRGRRGGRGDADAAEDADDREVDGAGAGESGDEHVTADADDHTGGDAGPDHEDSEQGEGSSSTRRRRRRRRRSGSTDATHEDDPDDTVVHVREPRSAVADVQGVKGSTRLEAKRQRRRDSRDSRRRPQILSEAEFLARRESVDRVMAIRQRGDLSQVALLEDGVLVEHFVSRSGSGSMIGNVYLGRVQNVLPSMEAAFVDIGKGRNAVLYAGEVNWDIAGLEGKARRIETALSSGDTVLVQVSKDPVGHKGARLTTQISLPGRFLVYVPGGGATGISRKLPDTERKRLKAILDRIVPPGAGVIIRTAAEGVGEDELAGDVERLKAQWEEISAAARRTSSAPTQLSTEPDTLIKVIRDLFNSDINRLLIDGDEAWKSVSEYVLSVAPELADRVSRYVGDRDVFAAFRIDEQIAKALQRKVHLPSGGSLVIDRTEAMTVIDVNTGKFTGSGGNLEETVTRNNLEAAEEIVRQLRLRDIGGIIVVDFIDMVLESNRELVLRRLTECLGRDRTRHQVAEVTSLGLVQMTRKRMGLGLVEAFSEPCPHCGGRGILLHDTPADTGAAEPDKADGDRGARKGRKRGRGRDGDDASKYEPLVVERVTADAKPDPRGPKAPRVFRQDGTSDSPGSPTEAPATVTEPADTATEQPADAVTDQPADAETGQPVDVGTGQPADAAAEQPAAAVTEPSSAPDAVVIASGAPATAKPARRRRAAARPAGAPATGTAAVDIVVPVPPANGAPATAVADGVASSGDAAGRPPAGAGGDKQAAADGGAKTPAAKPRRRRAASRAAGPVTD